MLDGSFRKHEHVVQLSGRIPHVTERLTLTRVLARQLHDGVTPIDGGVIKSESRIVLPSLGVEASADAEAESVGPPLKSLRNVFFRNSVSHPGFRRDLSWRSCVELNRSDEQTIILMHLVRFCKIGPDSVWILRNRLPRRGRDDFSHDVAVYSAGG